MGKRNHLKLPLKTTVLTLLITLVCVYGEAQVKNTAKDSTKLGHVKLKNPSSIITKYTYDPLTNKYIYTEKIGDVNISYPLSLTPDEYRQRVMDEQMKNYFKEKSDAVNGRGDNPEDEQKNLLPIFYVNNGFFQSVFGGNQ